MTAVAFGPDTSLLLENHQALVLQASGYDEPLTDSFGTTHASLNLRRDQRSPANMNGVAIASMTPAEGLAYLKRLLRHTVDPQFLQMVADRDTVHARYGRLFARENLDRLTADDFREFLLYENNRHWWGIHRHREKLVANMEWLRKVLNYVLDEALPIGVRLDWVEPKYGTKPLPGLGKAVLTPILHVVYPDRYGVWNSIAESAMTRLGFWPRMGSGWGFGSQYSTVNNQLHAVAKEVGVDLWTLDSLWWRCEVEHEPNRHQFEGGSSSTRTSTSTRRVRAVDSFICTECFQVKAGSLRSSGTDRCIDCSGET